MNIIISNSSGRPIYEQITSQLKQLILTGELKPHDMPEGLSPRNPNRRRPGDEVTRYHLKTNSPCNFSHPCGCAD